MSRTRSLEVWHIPKRQNIHQIIGAVEILSLEEFNGKSWTTMKQEKFNTLLWRHGLTEWGRPLSPSARRTLEALIKYLGFIFIDSTSTPTTIHVTNAWSELIKNHPSVLGLARNLLTVSKNWEEIVESDIVKHQMSKLQITNPVIKEDCLNILLFPFRVTLKLILELGYLTKEELWYIVFSMKKEDEYTLTLEKIRTFRLLPEERRNIEIEAFKQTEIWNLTLVQAPTAWYYMWLCVATGLCERRKGDLHIIDNKLDDVIWMIAKYKDIQAFDFWDNLMLWIDYFWDFSRVKPPLLVNIRTNVSHKTYVRIYNNENKEVASWVVSDEWVNFNPALFKDESYRFDFFSFSNAELCHSEVKNITSDNIYFWLPSVSDNRWDTEEIHEIETSILDLISGKDYDPLYAHHISVVTSITGKTNFNPAQLRGGRLEYLFYKLLGKYKDLWLINEVIWNWRVDELGVMYPALWWKEWYPDIYFFIDKHLYVLELTTIRANAMQWSAEGASVHDHIMNLQRKMGVSHSIIGVFSAPVIAPRLNTMFKHISEKEGIPHHTIEISNLLKELRNLPKFL